MVQEGGGIKGLCSDQLGAPSRGGNKSLPGPPLSFPTPTSFFSSLFTSQGEMKGNGKVAEGESFSSGKMSFYVVNSNLEKQSLQQVHYP